MKMMVLASAIMIAGLAACGGGTSGGYAPVALPTATPTTSGFAQPQALGPAPAQGNGSPWPEVPLTSPANLSLFDTGEAFTLASAVPVYDVGNNGVAFEFVANTNGLPVATIVGTASSGVDLLLSGGTLKTNMYLNNKPSVACGIGQSSQSGPTNALSIAYFECYGNPFI